MSGAKPERSEAFVVTASGKKFYFDRPEEFDYTVADIAPALGRLCRFSGQLGWWSVASHSLFVAELVRPEHRLRALLHDASEAFLVDLPGPLKRLPALAGYRDVEHKVEEAIYAAFGAPTDPGSVREVKHADRVALRAEALMFEALSDEWDVFGLPAVEVPEWLRNMSPELVELALNESIRVELDRRERH